MFVVHCAVRLSAHKRFQQVGFEELDKLMKKEGDPILQSGRQEMLEEILNSCTSIELVVLFFEI